MRCGVNVKMSVGLQYVVIGLMFIGWSKVWSLVCRHVFEVASLKMIPYLGLPTKNVITLVVTWAAPIGVCGGSKIIGPPPLRCERLWGIRICRIFDLLELCSGCLVLLCCRVIEQFRGDRKGAVWR